ncbi:MAG: DUF3465 domain-containing protein [bacterium]|nr:DUF3465 domain-containing protein [bacterium]
MAVHRRAQTLRPLAAALILALASACASHAEAPDNAAVCNDYGTQRSGDEVIATGHVIDVLGERAGRSGEHEGYLVKLDGNCDLLVKVETNTTITGPIALRPKERVVVKGVYIYNPLGGLIHWTHHDPRGRHVGGYVTAGGTSYQ